MFNQANIFCIKKEKNNEQTNKNEYCTFSIGVLFQQVVVATKNQQRKKDNKVLSYTTVKDIGDMNPHVYGGSMSAESMIYEPLVRNTKEGIKPLLAKKWDISKDGKTYTFHLRNDVIFHDGTKFDAEAVKKNIDAVQQNKKLHSWLKISTLIDDVKVKVRYSYT